MSGIKSTDKTPRSKGTAPESSTGTGVKIEESNAPLLLEDVEVPKTKVGERDEVISRDEVKKQRGSKHGLVGRKMNTAESFFHARKNEKSGSKKTIEQPGKRAKVLEERLGKWGTFVTTGEPGSAVSIARKLGKMSEEKAQELIQAMAQELAMLPPAERSKLTEVLSEALGKESLSLGRALFKATAGVQRMHSTVVKTLPEGPSTLTPERRRVLEGLNLEMGGHDLDVVARRMDDVTDSSSMAHLLKFSRLVQDISSQKMKFSERRQEELAPLVKDTNQEHLVKQMGFRTAKSQRNTEKGLVVKNPNSTSYLRTNPESALRELLPKVDGVLAKARGTDGILINSPGVLKKLKMMLPEKHVAKLSVEMVNGSSGLCFLRGTKALEKHQYNWDHMIHDLGATPSPYQLYELLDVDKTQPPPDFSVNNHAKLTRLLSSNSFTRLQEIARGKSDQAPVCSVAVKLIKGLTDKLGPKKFDPLTANALDKITELVDIMVASEHHPSTMMQAMDLMMDELQLVLATARPYSRTDYWDTMRSVLKERAPSITSSIEKKKIDVTSHLTSSGMDSLSTALSVVLGTRHGSGLVRPTKLIDYFETEGLLKSLKAGKTVTPREDVVVAALHPSTPFHEQDVTMLIDDVKQRLEARKDGDPPVALILDTTLETHPDPVDKSGKSPAQLDEILGALKKDISSGNLDVYLCKSFQKYASFGTGKVSAGDLTLLSKAGSLESAWPRAKVLLHELDLDMSSHDEGQLVVHMLKHGHTEERKLARNAARNAKFIDEVCWPLKNPIEGVGSSYKEGIPLLLRSLPNENVQKIVKNMLIDKRDSFSFLRTCYTDVDIDTNYVRINPGHESKQAMIEHFYALGHFSEGLYPGKTEPSEKARKTLSSLTIDDVKEHLTRLSTAKTKGTDPTVVDHHANIHASYLALALQNVKPKKNVVPLLTEFFATPPPGVTLEMRRYLATEFLSLTRKLINPDDTFMKACANAERVLPRQ